MDLEAEMKNLPNFGEKIPVEKFHVSPLNMRANEPFGKAEEDQTLIQQIWAGKKIVGPFKARPEEGGYGVFVGRRRFLAKRETGVQYFVVGVDVIIDNISEDEARRQSLIENLKVLRKDIGPISRAQKLNEIISTSSSSLRGTAKELGISPSTLSEWLKILEISPKMQEAVKTGILGYTDALKLARSQISHLKQEYELAEILELEGIEKFNREVERLAHKRCKRGTPKGKYIIVRITLNKESANDMELFKILEERAKANDTKVTEVCKYIIREHLKNT